MAKSNQTKRKPAAASHGDTPALEWAAAAVGALITLVLIAILVWNGISADDGTAPQLKPEIVRVVPGKDGYLLDLKVSNLSSQSAASVQLNVSLSKNGQDVETSTATIDYVPGRSKASGGLMVRADPRMHEVDLRVTGFEIP